MKAQYTTFFKKSLSKILPDSEKIQYLDLLQKLKTFSKKKALNYKFVNCRNDVYNYLNIDADLYSATLCVLKAAHSIIKTRAIVIFDKFLSVLHKFRALEDYCSDYMRDYKVVCVVESKNTYFANVAVKFK